MLHVSHEAPVLGLIFTFFLIVEPVLLLGLAAWLTRVWAGSRRALLPLAVRYTYGLVPLGFGMWLAHYCFHFLTGLYTLIPVTQNAVASLGWPFLGEPRWNLTGLPANVVQVVEIGFLVLGFAGSLAVTYGLAEDDSPHRPLRAFLPWAAVCLILWFASMWLIVSADGNARHADERIGGLFLITILKRSTSAGVLVGLVVALVLMLPGPASAHNGPPFPIIENKKIGPCIVALWTHPDVGTGAFYVFVEPPPGGTIPDDLKIEIGVQPVSGRLPEKFYEAQRVKSRGPVEYNAQAEFDRQELWGVRLVLQSSQGDGEATAQVEVTPPGFGRWDLLLYLFPFLLVAFLWFRGIARARRRRRVQSGREDRTASAAPLVGKSEGAR